MASRPRRAGAAAAVALALALGLAAPGGTARAHEFAVTDAVIVLESGGLWIADLRADADALALGVSPSADSAELAARLAAMDEAAFTAALDRARRTVQRRVRVRFDDVPADYGVSFPELDAGLAGEGRLPSVIGTTVRLTGRVPDQAPAQLSFFASRAFGPVRLTLLEQATARSRQMLLAPGERSPAFGLGEAAGEPEATAATSRPVATRYAVLGFEHIVPHGIDHVLFVLGLFLLDARLRPLLWQVTAFTAAHTASLALSMAGVVSLPSRPVETLIALSIVWVAAENLWTSELKPWRPAVVFGFGLLHGLGFAGALRELGLPPGRFLEALVAFNVGVELGQLAVIGAAWLLLGRFRGRDWYRRRVVLPASAAIALTALWWSIERGLGVG